MKLDQLKPNKILRGPVFPDPVHAIVVVPVADVVEVVDKGMTTGGLYEPVLTTNTQKFGRERHKFPLAIEVVRLSPVHR